MAAGQFDSPLGVVRDLEQAVGAEGPAFRIPLNRALEGRSLGGELVGVGPAQGKPNTALVTQLQGVDQGDLPVAVRSSPDQSGVDVIVQWRERDDVDDARDGIEAEQRRVWA